MLPRAQTGNSRMRTTSLLSQRLPPRYCVLHEFHGETIWESGSRVHFMHMSLVDIIYGRNLEAGVKPGLGRGEEPKEIVRTITHRQEDKHHRWPVTLRTQNEKRGGRRDLN